MSASRTEATSLASSIDAAAAAIEPQVIAWRRDFHAHPELGNREFRTAGIVAAHLRVARPDEVRTEVAVTGVVGVLKGALPGPVVALRADMDALPVAERGRRPLRVEGADDLERRGSRRDARLRPRLRTSRC